MLTETCWLNVTSAIKWRGPGWAARLVQLLVTETNEVFQQLIFSVWTLSDVFSQSFSKDSGRLDSIQFEHESAVPQYCRLSPKANWKVGLKGTSNSGLWVSTSIHCREPRQRQKEILRWGGEANRHLSALGNSSIDCDTNSSIRYARTHTGSHTHSGANEVQRKGCYTWRRVRPQSQDVAKFATAHNQLQFPQFQSLWERDPETPVQMGDSGKK